ncbi:MAG: hypothetical protein QOF58_8331 [Pseudonocardiales bacterium]|jgi:hypothetical protein|nr:hypothetical protein [Pseudonocardiales bacterium]
MIETARLAGFFAAHGVWCVSEGETLIPLLGYQHADGEYGMDRLMFDDFAEGARAGQDALADGDPSWVGAVLVADGYIHLEQGRTDALIIEAVDYGPYRQSMQVAVPYRPAEHGFAVHKPKFMDIDCDDPNLGPLGEAFFVGAASHTEANAVWEAHLDESI